MDLQKYSPDNAADYIDCFRRLAALTNSALDYAENKNDWASVADKNRSLARIAEGVKTLASLRGDSEVFYDARPDGLGDYQKEMYAIEDQLHGRLVGMGYVYPTLDHA